MRIEDQKTSAADSAADDTAKTVAPKQQAKQAAIPAVSDQATRVAPGADGIVQLPPGLGIQSVVAQGSDLVVTLSDGSQWVIPDGAPNYPQINIGQFQLLPDAIAALINGQTPESIFIPTQQSSGGNFIVTPGTIGDAVALGNLLGGTSFDFATAAEDEVIPDVDEEVELLIFSAGSPGGALDATASVNEAGLPARGAEAAGTNAAAASETTTGTIQFPSGDAPFTITINGTLVTGVVGQVIATPNGALTIASIAADTIGYSYTLGDNSSGDATGELLTIVVNDNNGDSATGTLTISIVDDAPIANANTNSAAEGAVLTANAANGVLANDLAGADSFAAGGGVVGVRAAGGNTTTAVTTGVGTVIQGQFGTLVLQANGSYVYDGNANAVPPAGASDVFVYTIRDGDGDQSTTTLTINLTDSGLAATNDDLVVDEAALAIGSNSASTAETATGTLNGNASGGTGPYSFALVGSGTGTYGTLTLQPNGNYSYTLATPYDTTPDANNGTNTENNRETFTYQVTDANGNTTTNTITVDIIDDIPTATANANSVTEGATLTVNAANGVLPNDVFGADGPAAGGGVVGVRAAGGNTTAAVTTGIGSTIQGQFGTLVLQANGSYVYTGTPNSVPPGGASDVFVYTIRDGDGDQSTTTLTINLADGGLVATNDDIVVNEAALPTGSNSASTAETATGTLNGNASGGTGPYTFALVGSGTGSFGSLTLQSNGNYSYTLNSPYDTSPDANNGTNTENNRETFTYQVTDANGNSTTSTITVDIIDDVPTANANANSVNEGATLTVNAANGVLPNDVFGADGPAAGGGAVGVRAANGNTTSAVTTGIGSTIQGQFGTLVLQANGSYVYVAAANAVPVGGGTDVFVYTIRDGDGDQSTTTLTITVNDGNLAATTDDIVVDEAALAIGSNPGSTAETASGTLADGNVSGGTGPYSFALVGSGTGSYGTLTLNPNGSYSYTLATPYDTSPDANNGINIENVRETFTYQATDANGNVTTGTITVDIVDDIPTASANLNSVAEGSTLTVNAANGVLPNDVFGADGPAAGGGVVGVRAAGGDTTTAVTSGVNTTIAGLYGNLVLQANGSYVYDSNPNTVPQGGASDVFVYTIRDGDGDQSTTTLTIVVGDGGLVATNDDIVVNEAALPTGSNSASSAETATGTLNGNATGGTGPYTFALVGSGTGSFGTLNLQSNGNYSYTLTAPYDTNPDANNGTNTENNRETFTYQVTDANGNTTTSTITVDIIDDVPTASPNSNSLIEGAVLTVNAANGVLPNDVFGADGPAAGGGVVGVRAAGADTTAAVTTGVNTTIAGLYGNLVLQANGSYVYDGNPNVVPPAGANDVFVYTIRDGDGDQSTTTLTITVRDSGLAATADDATVNEAGLQAGSNSASNSEIVNGTLADGNASGGTGPYSYALVGSGTGSFGNIVVNSNGTYTYTLTAPYDTSPDADNGTNIENDRETFTYQVTDANGNTTTSQITIDIIDDVPTANLNTVSSVEGATLNVSAANGVLQNDVFGADGPAAGGGVVGVRAAGLDTTTAVTTGVNTTIPGLYGNLVLQANGSYVYDGTPNAVPQGGASDVFVYTIRDADGDESTTTLTINLSEGGLIASPDDVSVNEAGLQTGSNSGSSSEIVNGTLADGNVAGGTGPYSYAVVGSGTGNFGTIVINPDGTYTYTLTSPYDTSPDADDGTNSENDRDTFTYQVTDGNGNTTTSQITIDIVDDVPTADPNSGSVLEGGVLTVSAANGVLQNDVFGADGPTAGGGVVGVRAAGLDLTSDVLTGVNTTISGLYGDLILQADGSYVYDGDPNAVPPAGASDVFVYTIRDGDGDLSTTTLTIAVRDSGLAAPDDADILVDEEALDPNTDGADLAGSTYTGSLPGSTAETDDTGNQLNATGGSGSYTYALQSGGNAATAGLYGTIKVNSDGTYVYTLTKPVDNPDADDGDVTITGAESFTYEVTDTFGNTTTGTIRIDIVDDVPTASDEPTQSVGEGATVTGTLDFIAGADGATVTHIGSDALIFGVDGYSQSIDIGNGSIKVKADGSYSFTADATGGPGSASATYTVTDGDGDTSVADVDFTITDVNEPDAGNSVATVDDDGLPAGNSASTTGDLDANSGDDAGDTSEASFTGTLSFSFGLDGGGSVGFAAMDGDTATIGQESVTYAWNSGTNTLTATGPRGDLFKVEITNPSTGAYKVTLLDNVLHDTLDGQPGDDTENDATAALTFTVTDADGSPADGLLTITFDDDMPSAYSPAPEVGTGVNEGGTTFTEDLNIPNMGADGLGQVVFTVADGTAVTDSGGAALEYNGQPLYYSRNTGDPTILEARTSATPGAGTLVFQIDLNAGAGTYTYTQFQVIGSSASQQFSTLSLIGGGNVDTKGIDKAGSPFDLILTTEPGESINTSANTIGISGGAAISNGELLRVDFVQNVSQTGSGPNAFPSFEDYYSTTEYRQDVGGLGGAQKANFIVRAIIVNEAPGSVPADPADGDDVFYGDGNDTFLATTAINIYNAAGTLVAPGAYAGLGIAVAAAPGGGWLITGLPNGYDFEIISTTPFNGVQIEGATGTDSFKLGAITIGTFEAVSATIEVPIEACDGDGDCVDSEITINLAPELIADNVTAQVDEAALATGTDPLSTDEFANGDLNAVVSGGTGPYTFAISGSGTGAHGNLVINPNGTYTYTLTSPVDSTPDANDGPNVEDGADSFTYEVTDANGTTSTGTLSIDIVDDVPIVTLATADPGMSVDESDLSTDDTQSFSFVYSTNYGADGQGGPVTYALSVVAGPSGLTDTLTNQAVILSITGGGVVEGRTQVGDQLVFSVSVDSNGVVTLNQARAVVHSPDSGPDQSTGLSSDALIKLIGTATDGDGDEAALTVNIGANLTFLDSAPVANDDAAGLTEGGPASVNFNVDTNDQPGADGAGSRIFTSLTGTYGNIVINLDGSQTYTLTPAGQAATDALGPGATLTDTFSYTLTDGDGDSDPAQLVVTLTGSNDLPTITDLTPSTGGGDASVDEDDLAAGTDPSPKDSLAATGTFTINSPDGVDDLTVGGQPVITNGTFAANSFTTPLGNTLNIYDYNPSTGVVSYTYTLNGAQTHGGAGQDALYEDFAVLLTDPQGDPASGTLSVRIVDDVPTIQLLDDDTGLNADDSTLGTDPSASFAGFFDVNFGADGAGAPPAVTYELGVVAGASGLVDTATGQSVILSITVGGVIEGRTQVGNDLVFTISNVGATITLDQVRAIRHSPDSGPNQVTGFSSNTLVTLTATATDGDGDETAQTVNIGDQFAFFDDAPDAEDDGNGATEDGPNVTGNVITNDDIGADVGTIGTDARVSNPGTYTLNWGTLTINADGSYSYNPNASAPTGSTDQFTYTLVDADGDTDSATLTITFSGDNSAPTADNGTATTGDAAGDPGGANNDAFVPQTANGTLNFDYGTDLPASFSASYDSGLGAATQSSAAGVTTFTSAYWTLTIDEATGVYLFTQTAPYPHAVGASTDSGVVSVTLTDNDSSTVTVSLTLTINDDTPDAVADSNGATEDGPNVTGNVIANDDIGADVGTIGTDARVTNPGVYTLTWGTLTINADGSYSYDPKASVPNGSVDQFTYTLTDADGDTDTATLTITFSGDNNAPTAENGIATTGDAAGDPGSANNDSFAAQTASGSLLFDYDSDLPATFSASYDSGLGAATQSSAAGVTTFTSAYWTLTINESSGAYVFTQTAPYPHAVGASTDSGVVSVTLTDSDNSTTTATLTLTINDDTPDAVADSNGATEDGSNVTGNVIANDDIGADVGTIGTDARVTNPGVYVLNWGTLTINADGSYSYDPKASVPNGSTDQFTYTLTDADGDTDTATLTITFSGDNNAPTAVSGTATTSDAAGDPGSANNDAFAAQTANGSLAFDYDSDLPATFSASYDSGLGAATQSSAAGVTTFTSAYWTLTINESSGAYVFTQTAPYPHAVGASTDSGVVSVTLTDSDNSTVTVSLTLTINDDTPDAIADSASAAENGPNISGNVITNDDIGADVGTIGTDARVTNPGTYTLNWGTLTINANGSYVYDPNGSVPNGSTDQFTYTLIDADGDTDTATLTITITGDSQKPTAGTANAQLDEDGLPAGLKDSASGDLVVSPDPDTNEATFAGTLNFSFGTDGAGSIKFVAGTETVNGVLYTYNVTGGGTTLTANDGTTNVFQAVLNPTTGTYTLTLLAPVDHLGSTPGVEDNLVFNPKYQVYDADDNTAAPGVEGTLSITIDDDIAALVTPNAVTMTNIAGGIGTAYLDGDLDVDVNYGADGAGKVFFEQSLESAASGLTSGNQLVRYDVSANGLILTGYLDSGAAGYVDGVDTKVFTIELQPSGLADRYRVSIFQALDAKTSVDFNGGGYAFSGGNKDWNGFVPTGETLGGTIINNNSADLLLTPEVNGVNDGTINTNAISGGVSNPAIGNNETFRVDFVTDLRGDPASTGGGDYDTAAKRDHVFDGHYTVNGTGATFVSTAGSTVKITAFDDPDGNNVVGDGVIDGIEQITITYNGVTSTLITPTTTLTNYTVNLATFSVLLNADGSVNVGGVKDTTSVAIFTGDGYNSVEYSYAGGADFAIGDFGAAVASTTAPVIFTVPVSIMDGDGDVTASGNLSITANAPPPVALDLDGDGLEFVDRSAGIAFDYNGDGKGESTGWVGSDDGLLVHDANGDGIANDAGEIVFSVDGSSDLEGVRLSYDSNGDGKLSAADAAYASFGVWQDANSNGRTDAGEYHSLSQLGIVSIDLVSNGIAYSPNADVRVHGEARYTRADGSTGLVGDVAFGTSATQAQREAASAQALANSLVAAGLVAAAGTAAPAAAIDRAVATTDADPMLQAPIHLERADSPSVEAASGGLHLDAAPLESLKAVHAPQALSAAAHDQGDSGVLDRGDDSGRADMRPDSGANADDGGSLIDHSALPLASGMTVDPGMAALIAPPTESLGAVLADALPQAAQGPDIDALLSGLPQAGAAEAAAMTGTIDPGLVPHDLATFQIGQFISVEMIANDAVMSTAQS